MRRYEAIALHHVETAARQHGKTQHSNAVLASYAAQNSGVPEYPVIMQVRATYVIWGTTGEVRTVPMENKS